MCSTKHLIGSGIIVCLCMGGCLKRSNDNSPSTSQHKLKTAIESEETEKARQGSSLPWLHSEVSTEGVSGDWRFVFGSYEPIGLPATAFLELYAVRNGNAVIIETFEDLQELKGLRIDNSKGALAVVRLLTAEDTYVIFEKPMAIEIDLDDATVSEKGDGFLIKRHLVYESDEYKKEYPCFEVTEQVSLDGKYEMIQKRFLRNFTSDDFRRGEFF